MPIPRAGIFDAPHSQVQINLAWVSVILGVLEDLDTATAWRGRKARVFAARQQVLALMQAISEEYP